MGLGQPAKQLVTRTVLAAIIIVGVSINAVECRRLTDNEDQVLVQYPAVSCRKHSALLTEFGGKGDGVTLNTKAFNDAISHLSKFASDGGAQLIVPPGKWLTGSFNLTSRFTLYLSKGAVLLASQNESDWPLIAPLPSYGLRDGAARFNSLISGFNLTDVIITGNNGTIDGQGQPWWEKFKQKKLEDGRPYLIEIMHSNQVQISNITLLNSPSWHVHPVYSSNIIVEGLTILAPIEVVNTDGINPDSCSNVKIQDCYIVSGDDCVAVKSGLDEYGIKYGMPMQHLIIRRLTCISPKSAAIALGSEMSGGIQDVRVEDMLAINTESGVRIKTGKGRGGYVKDIYARRLTMHTMKYVFWMTGDYTTHADGHFDPKAMPVVEGINYRDIKADNVSMTASLEGIEGHPFTGICISNVTTGLSSKPPKVQWDCTDIEGVSSHVTPEPCNALCDEQPGQLVECAFPEDTLPIDNVKLQSCSVPTAKHV